MHKNEKGMAMILTLIMLAVLAAMAVSFTFLSQAETWSTMNYRFMNQARDGAEAGVNLAANFLLNSYTPPRTGGADPISSYNLTSYPVQDAGNNNVVLSANSAVTAYYPASAAQTAFSAAGQGTFTAGSAVVNYRTSAALLAMREVIPYGNTCPDGTAAPCTIQTWRITGEGRIAGIRNAEVEVDATLERPLAPAFGYAAFGTSQVCNPRGLNFGGGGTTNSYDSTTFVAGVTPFDAYGGNVGTNGNMSLDSNSTVVNGSLSTPRSGVGSCASGAGLDLGSGTLTGTQQGLPQTLSFSAPATPVPTPPTTNDGISNPAQCVGLTGCSLTTVLGIPVANNYNLARTCASSTGNCVAGNTPTYGNLSLQSGITMHFSAGTYIMNSISLSGNSQVVIDSGPVILNFAGAGVNASQYVADFNGGSITNATLNPLNFQIFYAGTSDIRLRGGAASAATVYAPNGDISLGGGGDFYGSLLGYSVTVGGGSSIHYDRNLQNTAYTIGNYMLSGFTWRKF